MSARARAELAGLGVQPSKQRGQNFIINPFVVETIIQFSRIDGAEALVEIGPGLGALTAALYASTEARGGSLQLIEIEPELCSLLSVRCPNAKVHCADARHVDFEALGKRLTVFGNLPYSFSSEIVLHLARQREFIDRAILMLQREFAERLAAEPGSRSYGSLSVVVQNWFEVTRGPVIPGDAFHPPTKVESLVFELRPRPMPRAEVSDPVWFERVVRAAFSSRRRTIENALKGSHLVPAEEVGPAIERAGLSLGSRAEALTIEDFAALCVAFNPPGDSGPD
jgi:16S rRNA (adenine1518-N6/adenine1519-N6)-dimethyltransferase